MLIFCYEFLYLLLGLLLLGMCGGWAVLWLEIPLPFIGLASPLVGLILLGTSISGLYNLDWTLARCALLAFTTFFLLTVGSLFLKKDLWFKRSFLLTGLFPILVALVLSAAITVAFNYTSIKTGKATFISCDGSDQYGYIQVGNWVAHHRLDSPPVQDSNFIEQTWPHFAFAGDARFGCYFLVGLAGMIRPDSTEFSYEFVCALVFVSGLLGVAAVFARRKSSLLLIIFGLLISHWFDYSHMGYMGKLMAYPSALLLVGLAYEVLALEEERHLRIALLAFLATGIPALHSSDSVALILVMGWLAYPVLPLWYGPHSARLQVVGQSIILVVFCILALAASGRLVLPGGFFGCPTPLKWPVIYPRLFDLDNEGYHLNGYSTQGALDLLFIACACQLLLVGLAALWKNKEAFALGIGPLILISLFILHHSEADKGVALQMIGLAYPFSVCSGVLLFDQFSSIGKKWHWFSPLTVLAICLALIFAVRVPRFKSVCHRYIYGRMVVEGSQVIEPDLAFIRNLVIRSPHHTLLVDVPVKLPALAILSEFGQTQNESFHLQWSASSWQTLYTPGPRPIYIEKPDYVLTDCFGPQPLDSVLVFKDAQYCLYKNP